MSDVSREMIAWLAANWDQEEAAARKAGGDRWTYDGGSDIYRGHPVEPVVDWVYDEAWEHIARHDPASVLARIAADRQIVTDYEDHLATYQSDPSPFGEGQRFGLLMALARIAEGYADHPGFREEWRP